MRWYARPALLSVALAAGLTLTGCGSSTVGEDTQPTLPPSEAASATPVPVATQPLQITVNNATDLTKRPFIIVNQNPVLPTTLKTKDIVVGTGPTATTKDTVTVRYVGATARNGHEFDASYDTGAPATFALNSVIPGFRDGIAGMRVGGRRTIVMPPDQAYGAQGAGTAIGPNETLVFVVDLVKIG